MPKPHFIDYEHHKFVEQHQDKITGVIACFDRLIIKGTLSSMSYDRWNRRFM